MLLATRRFVSVAVVLACLWPAGAARASTILDTGLISFAASGTQFGRIIRDGVPSAWGVTKSFPGIVNPATAYAYEVFTFNAGATPFLQITLTDPDLRFFAAAYLNDYFPFLTPPNNNLDHHYLGDAGFSAANTALQIQVVPFAIIQVAVSGTVPGLQDEGRTIRLVVEGFDTPQAAVPEPATLALFGSGVVLALRRRTGV